MKHIKRIARVVLVFIIILTTSACINIHKGETFEKFSNDFSYRLLAMMKSPSITYLKIVKPLVLNTTIHHQSPMFQVEVAVPYWGLPWD